MPAEIRVKRGDEIVKKREFKTALTFADELAKLLPDYLLKVTRQADGRINSTKTPTPSSVKVKIRKSFVALLKKSNRG
jgi:hypothetical protein